MVEPWRGLFKALCRREEFQAIQVKYAQHLLNDARTWCGLFGVHSERALALLFDIMVQNGSISAIVQAQIQRDIAALEPIGDANAMEVVCLRIIANRCTEAAKPRWVEDVRARKLTIANGEGTVHGRHYNLQEQYGLGLRAI